jgi:hypothetical protein
MIKVRLSHSPRDLPLNVSLHQGLDKKTDIEMQSVWFDTHDIQGGQSWADDQLSRSIISDVILVLIGPDWVLTDSIEQEIVEGLKRKIPVLPILLEDATLPSREMLPETLSPILERQPIRYRLRRFQQDTDEIARTILRIVGQSQLEITDTNNSDILYANGFSNRFVKMFERLSNPNIGRRSVMMAHFGIDWDESQIPEFVNQINHLFYEIIDQNDLRDRFDYRITEETRFVRLRAFSRPSSVEAFLELVHPDQIVSNLVGDLILIMMSFAGYKSYRVAAQMSGKLRERLKPSWSSEIILLPGGDVINKNEEQDEEEPSFPLLREDYESSREMERFINDFVMNQSISGFRVSNMVLFGTEHIKER